ncbi:MAG: YceI family protein [Solirubrobacteraceae bacterium]
MPTAEQQAIAQATWNVDPTHSSVEFQVKHMGIATVKGFFGEFAGKLEVGESLEQSKAEGTVEVDSVNTREDGRDQHLKSPDFFDAANHTQITFRSTKFTAAAKGAVTIDGDLTIRGVTKSVSLEAVIDGPDTDPWGNERVGVEAVGVISRGDYGMKFNQALGSGNMLVSDKVNIVLQISAVKAA